MRIYESADMAAVSKRLSRKADFDQGILENVRGIIKAVQKSGDQALFDLTKRFDGFALSAGNIRVTRQETDDAYKAVPDCLLETLKKCGGEHRCFSSAAESKRF